MYEIFKAYINAGIY